MEQQDFTHELAVNLNGDPFTPPEKATGWRGRKMKAKGAPETAYGRNGLPLWLPIDATVDDLRAEVNAPGRYRLDPVDDNNRPIEGATAAYVYVHDVAPSTSANTDASKEVTAPLPAATDNVVIEAMRMNAEIARAVVNRFPLMIEASASLLRAADGAGLPARAPMANDDAIDDEVDGADDREPHKPSPLESFMTIVAQCAPMFMAAMGGKKISMPNVAEIFDWRKASAAHQRSSTGDKPRKMEAAPNAATAEAVEQSATDALASITPQQMAHFIAIQSALSPEEAAIAREVGASFSKPELAAWLDELGQLSVAEAVAKIRNLIGGKQSQGGV